MRRYVGWALALIVSLGLSGVASAADLAVKARPVPPPLYDWTGIYIGVHGGGDWVDKDWFAPLTPINIVGGCVACPGTAGTHSATGWLAGAQAGVNYQISNHPGSNIVLGVEVDGSWTDVHGSSVDLQSPAALLDHSKTDTMATFTARGGLAVDRTFIYAKAGGAYARDKFFTTPVTPPIVALQSTNSDQWGWVAGAGIEYAFLGNWSVKAEYNHLDFAKRTFTLTPTPGCGCVAFQYDIRQKIDLVKVGLNYKFDWATPVIAKY